MAEMSRRRGRPRREPRPGERVQLSFRVTPEVKRLLDAAAEASGRSQSQEAEYRLQASFDRQDLLTEVLTLAYGEEIAATLVGIGNGMSARRLGPAAQARDCGPVRCAGSQHDGVPERRETPPLVSGGNN